MYLYGNNIRSRALADQYVFYDKLGDDNSPPQNQELWLHISGQLDKILVNTQNVDKIVNELHRQAALEYKREVELIKQEYGVTNVSEELLDDGVYKDLIETINFQLQSKAVYERNLNRLYPQKKNNTFYKSGKVDITKFFWTYFEKAFNDYFNDFASLIQFERGETIDVAVEKAFRQYLPEVVQEALIQMYNSKAFTDQQNAKLKKDANQQYQNESDNAYKELVQHLETWRGRAIDNPLIQQIYKDYGFNNLISSLSESFLKTISKNKSKSKQQRVAKGKASALAIKGTIASAPLSGSLAEIMQGALINVHLNMDGGETRVDVKRTGNKNQQKADLMISCSINLDDFLQLQGTVADFIRKNDESNADSIRMQNILSTSNALKFFESEASSTQFITFVNMKNYTLDNTFEGFSAGSATNMENFYKWVQQIPTIGIGRANLLIGALLQFGAGAIGTPAQQEAVLQSLSETVAYFLFDDFATIGQEAKGNLKTIHLFWLSGIYVPLSFLLKVLADSIKISWSEAKGIVDFTLESPEILYPKEEIYTHEMWVKQSEDALKRTTLSMKFLKSFQDLLLPLLL